MARGHHEYRHYGYAPSHGYYHHNGDRWLGYGLGALIIGGVIANSQQYQPPVVYTTPYDGGYSTPPGYHWVQVPMTCYSTGINSQPYICGWRKELVPN